MPGFLRAVSIQGIISGQVSKAGNRTSCGACNLWDVPSAILQEKGKKKKEKKKLQEKEKNCMIFLPREKEIHVFERVVCLMAGNQTVPVIKNNAMEGSENLEFPRASI